MQINDGDDNYFYYYYITEGNIFSDVTESNEVRISDPTSPPYLIYCVRGRNVQFLWG